MLARPYVDTDYPEIVNWHMAWEKPTPPQHLLPKNGFIIPEVCAGFLYLTDSSLGIIDIYICNPKVPKYERNKYLNILTTEILTLAKQLGCKSLLATSNIDAIKKRSEFHGFKYMCETSVYAKEI